MDTQAIRKKKSTMADTFATWSRNVTPRHLLQFLDALLMGKAAQTMYTG